MKKLIMSAQEFFNVELPENKGFANTFCEGNFEGSSKLVSSLSGW